MHGRLVLPMAFHADGMNLSLRLCIFHDPRMQTQVSCSGNVRTRSECEHAYWPTLDRVNCQLLLARVPGSVRENVEKFLGTSSFSPTRSLACSSGKARIGKSGSQWWSCSASSKTHQTRRGMTSLFSTRYGRRELPSQGSAAIQLGCLVALPFHAVGLTLYDSECKRQHMLE